MASFRDFTEQELALATATENEFLDKVGELLSEQTYFEVEPTTEDLRHLASSYLSRQYLQFKDYLCSDEIIKKTSVLPPSQAAIMILELMKSAVTGDHTLLILTFALVRYTALYCVRIGLKRLCAQRAEKNA